MPVNHPNDPPGNAPATPASQRAALARVRIVLVDTQEPANIGAAARALKTMGLSRLELVRPAHFPHGSASKLALAAIDVLDRTRVSASLHAAIADCHAVYAVSARQRRIPLAVLTPRALAPVALAQAGLGDVAIVFGGEEAGLSNADIALCSALVQIPSDPDCRSLNLAAAVQLLSYELRLAVLEQGARAPTPRPSAPMQEFEGLLSALDQALAAAGYYANKNPSLALEQLRRMLQRFQLRRADIKMLRGVIAQLTRPGPPP